MGFGPRLCVGGQTSAMTKTPVFLWGGEENEGSNKFSGKLETVLQGPKERGAGCGPLGLHLAAIK